MLATWLSTFSSGGRLHLVSLWSGQEWEEWASSFLAFSCSHHAAFTSCLVDLPILPAWPINVLLKYMIDRIQIILPHHFPLFFKQRKISIVHLL